MATSQPEVTYRISKQGGWVMMMVALFLDMLPFIVLVGVMALMLGALGNTVVDAACSDNWFTKILNFKLITFDKPLMLTDGPMVYDLSNSCDASKVASVAAAGAASFMISPLIFFVSTAAASLIAICLFPMWFYFGKNYIMVSFAHFGKLATNISSFAITTILKWMPIVNLFPLPVYTLTVWRHVQISRHEDRQKQREANKKRMRVLKRYMRMAQGRETAQARNARAEYQRLMAQQQYLPNPDSEFLA